MSYYPLLFHLRERCDSSRQVLHEIPSVACPSSTVLRTMCETGRVLDAHARPVNSAERVVALYEALVQLCPDFGPGGGQPLTRPCLVRA